MKKAKLTSSQKETIKNWKSPKEIKDRTTLSNQTFLVHFLNPSGSYHFYGQTYDKKFNSWYGIGLFAGMPAEFGSLPLDMIDATLMGTDRLERDVLFKEKTHGQLRKMHPGQIRA
jgi:hypothetical protein